MGKVHIQHSMRTYFALLTFLLIRNALKLPTQNNIIVV